MLFVISLSIVAYLLGSAPWGLVIAKVFCGVDPRLEGSRNTGATNVARLCGFGFGVATLFCDIFKGVLPVLLAMLDTDNPIAISTVAFFAVLGHVFSCFLGFRGGKAVATSIGVFLPLAFGPTLLSCLVCIAVIAVTRFVSLGSLCLLGSLPVTLAAFGAFVWVPLALALFVLVAYRHRENIARLKSGTENRLTISRKGRASTITQQDGQGACPQRPAQTIGG